MANALRSQADDQLVLTPDGRQISQRNYRPEQQRREQTDKLNSLKENPIAAGMYGATGNDTATGMTAGLEGIGYSLGSMGYARAGNKALSKQGPYEAPQGLVMGGMPSKSEQKGYPGVPPAIDMNNWALGKTASEQAELQKNVQLKAKALLEMLNQTEWNKQGSFDSPRAKQTQQDMLEMYRQTNPELFKATDLGSHMQLYEPPPKPGAEEQARKDLHKKAGFGDLGSLGVANKEQSSQMFQPADLNEYEMLDNSSPDGYAAQAFRQQFYMPDKWNLENVTGEPFIDAPYRQMSRHETKTKDLVTSGNWAKPMNPVADLIEALRRRGKKNE